MEEQLNRLVELAWNRFLNTSPSHRFMIGVSGIPGSGKTVLASTLAIRLNKRYHEESPGLAQSEDVAAFIPMDGYHLSRAQLSALPDPHIAHARRGAEFTFDAPAFLKLIEKLREPICAETETIYAPSFDHALKDPVADDIAIHPEARILVFEGNYLSLGTGAREWRQAAQMMDQLWFVEVDEAVARKRLIARHVLSGIAEDEEEAERRVDENDLVNGQEIIRGRLDVHEVIQSREDSAWRAEKQRVDKERDGGLA